MNEPKHGLQSVLVDIPLDLDEEQLAQIDALIKKQSTPSHRPTRDEVLLALLNEGLQQVEHGRDLVPYLKQEVDQEAESAP